MPDSSEVNLPQRFAGLSDVFRFLKHPHIIFERLATAEGKVLWKWPVLTISLTLLLRVMITGAIRARLAAMGQPPLPPDWEWWTPEMQNNYMQAMQVTQGPAFLYIIPAVTGLVGLWLRWLVVGGLLHLASTLLGGRGSTRLALGLAAWALLPFAIRDLLQVSYMLLTGHPIASPGLSGFVVAAEGGALFLAQILKQTDLFLLWYLLLLAAGLRHTDGLSRGKAWLSVLIVILLVVTAQAGLGMLGARLSTMIIFRPF